MFHSAQWSEYLGLVTDNTCFGHISEGSTVEFSSYGRWLQGYGCKASLVRQETHQIPQLRKPYIPVKGQFGVSMHQCLKINWDEAVIITKDQVNHSWELVCSVLGKSAKRRVTIYPFQANQAVWWPINKEEGDFLSPSAAGFF